MKSSVQDGLFTHSPFIVNEWLVLSPHLKKVPGLNIGSDIGLSL